MFKRSSKVLITALSFRRSAQEKFVGIELNQKILGAVGTGNVGREVIKRASGFNIKIIVFDPYLCEELIEKYEVVYLPMEKVIANLID